MRIVFISDTHGMHGFDVPAADCLVHAGDFTMHSSGGEIKEFDDWLDSLPHTYKVVVAGNHDVAFEESPEVAQRLLKTPIYLQDSSIVIEGVKFYGSPWTPWFFGLGFNLQPGRALEMKWDEIPHDVDVLVRHGPPYGIFDLNGWGEHCGDEQLLEAVERIKPKIHAFGHIHYSHDAAVLGETLFVNACISNDRYDQWQKPVVVDLVGRVATLVEDQS